MFGSLKPRSFKAGQIVEIDFRKKPAPEWRRLFIIPPYVDGWCFSFGQCWYGALQGRGIVIWYCAVYCWWYCLSEAVKQNYDKSSESRAGSNPRRYKSELPVLFCP
ncbi:hypothetical protein O9929_07335 [Vibrio lentus]|nr:hypothetical protein [Vibrio lentus]